MLKAIVVDDEPMAHEVLKGLTEKVTFVDIAGYYYNAFEAMEYLNNNTIDLIFLDIKMPGMSGIELLRTLPQPPMVIFTTGYSEHAVESFELDAIDYLLKPFSLVRFLKACNKAYEQYAFKRKQSLSGETPQSIFIKSGYEQVKINIDEIIYAEGSGNYVQFVLNNKKIASRLTMIEAAALLPEKDFIRIHRSFIISKKHLTKADKRSVWVNQTELPIGPAYAAAIDKIIK
jgi:DNA-binding LytR/AlgR family response regulator